MPINISKYTLHLIKCLKSHPSNRHSIINKRIKINKALNQHFVIVLI